MSLPKNLYFIVSNNYLHNESFYVLNNTKTISTKPSNNLKLNSLYFTVIKSIHLQTELKIRNSFTNINKNKIWLDKYFIKKAYIEDTGIYKCYWKNQLIAQWALTVVKKNKEPFKYVYTKPDPFYLSKTYIRNNLLVYINWMPWSACVPCMINNKTITKSIKIRNGICYVKLLNLFYPVKPQNLALEINDFLQTYSEQGLPCRSHLIENVFTLNNLIKIIKFPSVIHIQSCQKICALKTKYVYIL